ncbi:hypothetical protein H1R20_g14473, partial [Candolleomyces eurysporus]
MGAQSSRNAFSSQYSISLADSDNDDRPATQQVVYYQQGNRAPIYNGPISGGVNNLLVSNVDALQFLYQHAATGAMHDSDERFPPPLCHPGTRETVIYRILDWYGYKQGPRKPIMWVYAPAGYGKTAIAGTVAERLEDKSAELDFCPIGATFFFWRTSMERNSPARFIITLAYQLATSIPELTLHIENAVKRNPMILSKALEEQLKKLIVQPFKALGETRDIPNRLIVIDGLDECINSDQESRIEKQYAEDQETAQIRVLDLIHALASHQLPLSFLILSRPEAWIKQHIESQKFKDLVDFVDLCEVGDHLKDVETFVTAELSRLGLDEEDLVERLVRRAGRHMLYASTVIRHIDCPYGDPRLWLENILKGDSSPNPDLAQSTPFSSLHELYRQILQSCPQRNRSVMIEVLEEIVALDEGGISGHLDMERAFSIVDHLSGRVPGTGMKAVRGLHAVLNLSGEKDCMGNRVSGLRIFTHSSFPEFLLDPHLFLEFRVNVQKGRERLLSGCLRYLSSITLDSKVDADHIRFAVADWTWLWFCWVHRWRERASETPMLLNMFQKLLSIDLMPCFVHPFTLGDPDEVGSSGGFVTAISNAGTDNCIIPLGAAGRTLYNSEPLARQAVSHVTACYKAAVVHLLKTYIPYSNYYNILFICAVSGFLTDLRILLGKPGDWGSDTVVHALNALKRESPEHFVKLMVGVYKAAHFNFSIFPTVDETRRSYEALIAFILSDDK